MRSLVKVAADDSNCEVVHTVSGEQTRSDVAEGAADMYCAVVQVVDKVHADGPVVALKKPDAHTVQEASIPVPPAELDAASIVKPAAHDAGSATQPAALAEVTVPV